MTDDTAQLKQRLLAHLARLQRLVERGDVLVVRCDIEEECPVQEAAVSDLEEWKRFEYTGDHYFTISGELHKGAR